MSHFRRFIVLVPLSSACLTVGAQRSVSSDDCRIYAAAIAEEHKGMAGRRLLVALDTAERQTHCFPEDDPVCTDPVMPSESLERCSLRETADLKYLTARELREQGSCAADTDYWACLQQKYGTDAVIRLGHVMRRAGQVFIEVEFSKGGPFGYIWVEFKMEQRGGEWVVAAGRPTRAT
jgi:hypothetical protein